MRELAIVILQQAVDDFIWCCGQLNRFCPDERYTEYYYKENGKTRSMKEILLFKREVYADVKDFFEGKFADSLCQEVFDMSAEYIWDSLNKRYQPNSLVTSETVTTRDIIKKDN